MTVIAEIGTSHSGDIIKAKELIDASKEAGSDAVKFQWVYADEILHPATGFVELPGGKVPLYERFRSLEVKPEFFSECAEYARKKNILFVCSPFGLRSLSELYEIKPDFIKIASPELNHVPLLKKSADLIKSVPFIVSSGVSTLSDIECALKILTGGDEELKKRITLLHCSTFYPTPEEEYNVNLVRNLSSVFGVDCGISDHSLDPVLVPVLSVMAGGTMIEKHITLSNETDGLDDPVALTPEKFCVMTRAVHQTVTLIERYRKEENARSNFNLVSSGVPQAAFNEVLKQLYDEYGKEKVNACLGDGVKRFSKSERENYGRTNRSLRYVKNLKKGSCVEEGSIAVLRTEKVLEPGLHPSYLDFVLGKKLTKDVKDGEAVKLSDFTVSE